MKQHGAFRQLVVVVSDSGTGEMMERGQGPQLEASSLPGCVVVIL